MPLSDTQRNAVALTIAGSDPSGGAGLQADLKTFQELGVYGMSVVTLLTVQNTQGVTRVDVLSAELVEQQLDAVLNDIPPAAIKTGALGNAEIVECVGRRLQDWKRQHPECAIVVDPVLVSKHGHSLVTDDVDLAYRKYLIPLATVITPNRFEAGRLIGATVDSMSEAQRALRMISEAGAEHVLIKLGDLSGESVHLWGNSNRHCQIQKPRLKADGVHGTGCVLAALIAAGLAVDASHSEQQSSGTQHLDRIVNAAIDCVLDAVRSRIKVGSGLCPANVRMFRNRTL